MQNHFFELDFVLKYMTSVRYHVVKLIFVTDIMEVEMYIIPFGDIYYFKLIEKDPQKCFVKDLYTQMALL